MDIAVVSRAKYSGSVTVLLFVGSTIHVISTTTPPSARVAFWKFKFSGTLMKIPLSIFRGYISALRRLFISHLPGTMILPYFLFPGRSRLVCLSRVILNRFNFSNVSIISSLTRVVSITFQMRQINKGLGKGTILPKGFFNRGHRYHYREGSRLNTGLFRTTFRI